MDPRVLPPPRGPPPGPPHPGGTARSFGPTGTAGSLVRVALPVRPGGTRSHPRPTRFPGSSPRPGRPAGVARPAGTFSAGPGGVPPGRASRFVPSRTTPPGPAGPPRRDPPGPSPSAPFGVPRRSHPGGTARAGGLRRVDLPGSLFRPDRTARLALPTLPGHSRRGEPPRLVGLSRGGGPDRPGGTGRGGLSRADRPRDRPHRGQRVRLGGGDRRRKRRLGQRGKQPP